MSEIDSLLRLVQRGDGWALVGSASAGFALVDEYLAYLSDCNYSPRMVRAYGFDLLAFCRWLVREDVALDAVTTDVLLRFLRACCEARIPRRLGPNVIRLSRGQADRYTATTINRRLSVISGLFAMRSMRKSTVTNPVPKGREARRTNMPTPRGYPPAKAN